MIKQIYSKIYYIKNIINQLFIIKNIYLANNTYLLR